MWGGTTSCMNQGAIEACQNAKKRVAQESCRIEKIGHALVLSPIQRILFPNNFVINEILITCFLNVFHCCEHKNYFLVAINNSIATISFFANPPYKLLLMSSSLFLKNHLIYGWCCCTSHYYWYSRPTTDLLPMTILLLQK